MPWCSLLVVTAKAIALPATMLPARVLQPRGGRRGAEGGRVVEDATGRVALRRLMRQWRGRIPDDQAAPRGRRSGTLTQEGLARLTGYSLRTISGLEQGGGHRPAPDLLSAIVATLRLSAEERRTLWQLAVGTPPPDDAYATEPEPVLVRMLGLLQPHPAYLCDAAYNVLAHNQAFAAWIDDFTARPRGARNLLRWMFGDEHARHVLAGDDDAWRRLVARIRAIRLRIGPGNELATLVDELRADNARFRRLWDEVEDVAGYLLGDEIVHVREPGHTDPEQVDNTSHVVPLTMCALSPLLANDERRFVVLLLPKDHPVPQTMAPQTCPACGRDARRGLHTGEETGC
jgi:transcriptional regulator with XRE-family HTH domain